MWCLKAGLCLCQLCRQSSKYIQISSMESKRIIASDRYHDPKPSIFKGSTLTALKVFWIRLILRSRSDWIKKKINLLKVKLTNVLYMLPGILVYFNHETLDQQSQQQTFYFNRGKNPSNANYFQNIYSKKDLLTCINSSGYQISMPSDLKQTHNMITKFSTVTCWLSVMSK